MRLATEQKVLEPTLVWQTGIALHIIAWAQHGTEQRFYVVLLTAL